MAEDVKRYAGGCILRMLKDGRAANSIAAKEINEILTRKFGSTLSENEINDIIEDIASRGIQPEKKSKTENPIEQVTRYLNSKGCDAVIIYRTGKAVFWNKVNKDE